MAIFWFYKFILVDLGCVSRLLQNKSSRSTELKEAWSRVLRPLAVPSVALPLKNFEDY